ncbi:MAG: hypothetical protein Q8L69_09120 [Gallionellaceae bacterium]|nr:hypothetical protein [Gallionellaceae bacterium]
MAKRIRPADLPILTETVGGEPLELPTLTETPEEQPSARQFGPEQCRLLAEALFPRLEAMLLEAISSSPDADWQTAMRQVRDALPELIYQTVQKQR